jgi:hypothetical protein
MLPYGCAAAILLYEKQQVAIHQEDGPVGSPPSLGWGTPMPLPTHESGHSTIEGATTLLGWDTYATLNREVLTAGTLARSPPPQWDGGTPVLSPTPPS